ncbi:CBS domain-containing protein [Plasmodiophora brassicae]|nr:hypothetical protein PBRA_005587 [Plasmodiophora brassicae]
MSAKHAAFGPLDALLQRTVSEAIPADRKIATLHQFSTVKAAIELFMTNRVLSAPVTRPHKSIDNAMEWIGIVSYHDLLRYLSAQADPRAFLASTMADVMAFAASPPLQIESRSHIIDAIEFLSSVGRLHRCIVTGHPGSSPSYSVVSQSDINRFVSSHLYDAADLAPFANTQLADLGFASKSPCHVKASQTLKDAINIMAQKSVSCLAIVDGDQHLVGNFSPSDLRGIGTEIIDLLNVKIVDVLKARSPESLKPVSVSATETIGVLMARMANTHLHHIWLQAPSGKPDGLVTLTDIMNVLLKFDPSPVKE